LLQGQARSTASLEFTIRFILTEQTRSTLVSLKFPFVFVLVGIIVALWR